MLKRNCEEFKHNLLCLMDKKNLQQSDIAYSVGVERSTVSRWCKGLMFPKGKTLLKLAECLGTTPNSLIGVRSTLSIMDEEKLLHDFRMLSPVGKEKALERVNELTQLYWYEGTERIAK